MLRPLQRLLETIYDAPSGADVEQFLITGREHLPATRRGQAGEEEVVVVEHGDEARVGVFIDHGVLQRLRQHDPLRTLDGRNIGDFWTAIEGVSHFCYLMWNGRHARGVSQLELELQGEVDKYIASLWLLRAQNPGHFPRELRHAQFARTTVDPRLDAPARHLYATASRYAARFCQGVERTLSSDRPVQRRSGIALLRRFYRLGSTRKLAHIEALG